MADRQLTRLIQKNPRILLRPDGRRAILADAIAAAPMPKAAPTAGDEFTAIGYRQTMEPAAGGGKSNANGFRFRSGSMRALARSFRGKAFITGHDWGDARARGGTITDAWAEEMTATAEMAILYEIVAQAPWAKEGLANGTIDRFSFGVVPMGEITCTVHGTPAWAECGCFPGDMVAAEPGGVELEVEWEFEHGEGVELSAVNVPAVDDTFIVDAAAATGEQLERWVGARMTTARELAALCGRAHPALDRLAGGAPVGGFPRARAPRTMAITPPVQTETQMDPREEMAKALGLPVDATWEQIRAKQATVTAAAAQADVARTQLAQSSADLTAERARTAELAAASDRAHVEAEITRLRSVRLVSDDTVASLRTSATAGRATFDASIKLVELAAAPARPALQSDLPAVVTTPVVAAAQPEPDAFEQHQTNPELGKLMRACKLSVADVRAHGPKSIAVIHNLGDLITATAARGA